MWCILIVLLGAVLRIHGYDTFPAQGWTWDEYAYAWDGISLLTNHTPSSWSWLPAYGNEPIHAWEGGLHRIVSPWFDHPPLFSIICGFAAMLGGVTALFQPALFAVRIPSLIFGIASIGLLYILARKLFGTRIAVISSLIFATNPSIIYLSRLAVSENLIVFFGLAVLLLFLEFCKSSKKSCLYVAAILAGLASLAKVTGLFIVVLLAALLIYKKKWKEAIICSAIGIIIFSIYFIFGGYYNFALFMSVLAEQSARFNSIMIFNNILFPNYMPFFDMWSMFGWLALFYVVMCTRKKYETRIISFPIVAYLFILLFLGSQSHFYPWYLIPFYPFLCIALGIFFSKFLEEPDLVAAALILAIIGTWCLNYTLLDYRLIVHIKNFYIFKYIFIGLFSAIMLCFFYYGLMPKSKKALALKKILTFSLFSLLIVSNVFISVFMHLFLPGKT